MGFLRLSAASIAVFLAMSAFADVLVTPFRPLTTEIPRTAVPKPGSLQPQRLPRETVHLCKDPTALRQESEAKLKKLSGMLNAWRKGDPNKTPEEFIKGSGLEKLLQKQQVPPEQIEAIKKQLAEAMRLGDRIQRQSVAKEGGDR